MGKCDMQHFPMWCTSCCARETLTLHFGGCVNVATYMSANHTSYRFLPSMLLNSVRCRQSFGGLVTANMVSQLMQGGTVCKANHVTHSWREAIWTEWVHLRTIEYMPSKARFWQCLLIYPFNSLFSVTTCVNCHQKGKPFWILMKQEMMGGSRINGTIFISLAPHSRQCLDYYLRRQKEVMFSVRSVCLSVCPSDYSQTCERILTKFCGGVGRGSRTKWYNFGGDPDHASDPGVQSPKSRSAEVCSLWVHSCFCMSVVHVFSFYTVLS